MRLTGAVKRGKYEPYRYEKSGTGYALCRQLGVGWDSSMPKLYNINRAKKLTHMLTLYGLIQDLGRGFSWD
jgi:hypothetical protein